MNFNMKSCDVFSWTAMRGGLFRLENYFTAILADNCVAKLSGQIDLLIKMKDA